MTAGDDVAPTATKNRRFDREVDGILLLDKPTGISSNRALQDCRVLYRALKAGHAGSLDPLATGMLPICFGQATKVCAYLLDSSKTYRFTAKLGERTDTGDSDGTVTERAEVPSLDEHAVRTALAGSLGKQSQVPPMYSALKHEGQRLYELARRGEEVEREPRTISIERLDLKGFDGRCLDVVVRCSKGTYVRTLAEDLARKLGTIAHLTALRREQVDPFAGLPMHTLAGLSEHVRERGLDALDELLLPADRALTHLAQVDFDASGTEAVFQGRSVGGFDHVAKGDQVRIYGSDGRFLGLGEGSGHGSIQPRRLLIKPLQGRDLS